MVWENVEFNVIDPPKKNAANCSIPPHLPRVVEPDEPLLR